MAATLLAAVCFSRFCAGGGEEGEGPFPGEAEQAEEEVDDLEDRDRADAAVEVGGEEVEEDFGPEEGVYAREGLVGGGGQDEQAGPVVLDQLAHGRRTFEKVWGGDFCISILLRLSSRLEHCFLVVSG